jgi:hypothetical protein
MTYLEQVKQMPKLISLPHQTERFPAGLIKSLLFFTLVLGMVGCGEVSEESFNKIGTSMRLSEVRDLLGYPDETGVGNVIGQKSSAFSRYDLWDMYDGRYIVVAYRDDDEDSDNKVRSKKIYDSKPAITGR